MNDLKPFPATPPAPLKTGLSVTSLALGILAFLCFLILTGLPAIITGHMARKRAKQQPETYGGAGLALAGLILGYLSIPWTILVIATSAALLLPALAKGKDKASTAKCVNNMKQIGLAARIYSNDHQDTFPPDFISMSNELATPNILICPGDASKSPALSFADFDPSQNVSYEFLTPGGKEPDVLTEISFRCPVHNNIGMGDGSVQQRSRRR